MGDNHFKNKYKIDSTRLKYWDYGNPGYYFVTICVKEKVHSFGEIKNGSVCLSDIGLAAYNCWLEISQHFSFVELYEFVVMPNHVHGVIFIGGCDDGTVETQHFASPFHHKTLHNNQTIHDNIDGSELDTYMGGKLETCGKNETYGGKPETRDAGVGGKPETRDAGVGDRPETQNIASLQQKQRQNENYKNKFGPQSKNLSSIIRGFKIGVTKYATINKIPFIWQPRFHDHIIRNEYEMGRIQEYINNNSVNWEKDIFYFNN